MLDIKIFKYNKMSSKKINSVVKKLVKKFNIIQDRNGYIDYYDNGNELNLIRFKKNNKIDKTLVEKKEVIEKTNTIFDEIKDIKSKSKSKSKPLFL
tara:strand:+ start:184 stop:471 length:288 start_codon:yes stop_codon:yes gene_type:complete